jgi:heme/copper-type cytochrome/quinol oxidase subunit 1
MNLTGGNISAGSIIGTIIGAIIFAYPIYYIFYAIKNRRWSIINKYEFEIGVLRVASALALLICFSILLVMSSNTSSTSTDTTSSKNKVETLESALVSASNEMNKDLPAMVDKVTQMTSTSASGNELSFSYKILTDSKITQADLDNSLRKGATNQACTTPETKELLNAGAKFVYLYYDNSGQYIGKMSLSASDCH